MTPPLFDIPGRAIQFGQTRERAEKASEGSGIVGGAADLTSALAHAVLANSFPRSERVNLTPGLFRQIEDPQRPIHVDPRRFDH